MRLEPNVQMLQKQAIVVSTQALQSLSVLQFSRDELEGYLHDQAERNPFIEIAESGHATVASQRPALERPAPKTRSFDPPIGSAQFGTDFDPIALLQAAETSLHDRLASQARLTFRDPQDLAVAFEILESLDGDGYLRRDVDELAETLGASPTTVRNVLSSVQRFEPAGISARDLAECLRLQLIEKGTLRPEMELLFDNLSLVADFNHGKLARICGVGLAEIAEMLAEIRALDPRPSRGYESGPTAPALPDVLVSRRSDGTFAVELNNNLLPRVLINYEYSSEIRTKSLGKDEKRFVMDCIQSANWLIKNLHQRAKTVLLVASEIVARQEQFLIHGDGHLRPLSLRDVAEAVGIHESTVCRAIANKYMMTHRGMFELKQFFANSITGQDGEDVSSEAVRHRIKRIVDAETASTVLSDDAIVDVLRGYGIDIARRTVAKYRDMMRIPSSMQRRRMKRVAVAA